ncbi:hypothetical protein CRH02_23800, partial [Escherichia albertii]
DRTNITVGYPQTNRKIDTGKTLTRWPVFVDHFTAWFFLPWGSLHAFRPNENNRAFRWAYQWA